MIHKKRYDVPCRVIASVKRKRFGTQPIVYKFDFLIEKGPSRYGMVAHELEHWIEEDVQQPDAREVVKDIPTDVLAQILFERLKETLPL